MNIITGEKWQNYCDVGISKEEQKQFESHKEGIISLDIDTFNFDNYDNPPKVYANSALLNRFKPHLVQSEFINKLKKFKNPFDLFLHNSDDSFDDHHLVLFDIPNIKKIYSQNVNTVHERLVPIPIGLANSKWKWGDLNYFESVVKQDIPKTQDIYFNFELLGGERKYWRPLCYAAGVRLNLKESKRLPFKEYVPELAANKFCLSPEGNGIDCHRMWECFYLKVIPICHRNVVTEHFAKYFPIILVDDWNKFELSDLEGVYEKANWSNYYLLDFDLFVKKFVG